MIPARRTSFLLGSPAGGSPQAKDELLFPSPFLLERQKGEVRDSSAHPRGTLGLFTSPWLWDYGTSLAL